MKSTCRLPAFVFMVAFSALTAIAQGPGPVKPADCVTTRYLTDDYYHSAIQMNSQGTHVAYLVRSPNLAENRNDIELYVRALSDTSTASSRRILLGWPISQLQWLPDGKHILALVTQQNGNTSLMSVDIKSGASSVVWNNDGGIKEYSMSRNGRTVVFAVEHAEEDTSPLRPTAEESARGYRIPFDEVDENQFAQRSLFVTKLMSDGAWSRPVQITIRSPFSRREMTLFPYVLCLHLSISPDGSKLLMSYVESRIPDGWKNSPYLQSSATGLMAPVALVDLSSGKVTVPIDTPMLYNVPVWSDDSKSFAAVAESPVNSKWERMDIAGHLARGNAVHMFWTNAENGDVEEVAPHVANTAEQPLLWDKSGHLLIHTSGGTLKSYSREAGVWQEHQPLRYPAIAITDL